MPEVQMTITLSNGESLTLTIEDEGAADIIKDLLEEECEELENCSIEGL